MEVRLKMSEQTPEKLSEEDQARVDRYLNSGYNRTSRKGFKPLVLLIILAFVVWGIGYGSALITKLAGVE